MRKIIILFGNIRHILRKNSQDNIPAIAAQSAFFIILSFVPFVMFAMSVFSLFGISQGSLEEYVEIDSLGVIGYYIRRIISDSYKHNTGVAVTTIVLALWLSAKGAFSVNEGIRRIYRIPDDRNWFIKRVTSMGYTILMFLAIALALVGMVLTEVFDSIIQPLLYFVPNSVLLVYTFRYILLFVVVVFILALAMKLNLRNRISDKRFYSMKTQIPGAALTTLSWIIYSLFVRIYVEYFNGFSIYGSLGSLAVVMIWMYFSMYIMLFCVQINYIYRLKFYNFNFRKFFRIPFFKRKNR